MLAAISGSLLLNYYFAPPLHTLTIRDTNDALAIGVFILVAALVSSVVDLAAANWNTSLGAACFLACAIDTLRTGKASKMPLRRELHALENALGRDLRRRT